MNTEITGLPSNIMTTARYEEERLTASALDTELGRDAFLLLFTTQLQNQNPLSPMDNEAFVAQLAQFSSLESMKGMQASLEDLATRFRSDRFYAGADLLGRSVAVGGGDVQGGDGTDVTATATVPSGANTILFTVTDESGEMVYADEYAGLPPGTMEFTWNGRDNVGNTLPAGRYRLAVMAERDGAFTNLGVSTHERITSVRWDADAQDLMLETESGAQLGLAELDHINL